MKNKLIDLNNHLFSQLERLGDEDKKGEVLKEEIDRSKAVAGVAKNIIDNARLALDVEKTLNGTLRKTRPEMLKDESK